ncbi:SEC-C metal-binding domain-containing protein [Lysobacter sp. 22409]|uniref:SEC-C metal-binding domain-containing protein n=1 Tax=Lysobacter sp. 22409 TaxID=3453917 RepID=UPI003F83D9E5
MHPLIPTLDPAQEIRIAAVHRGFLYQHLYAVGCLLVAESIGLTAALIERDEDVELVLPTRRIYLQVKTRSQALIPSDITSALERFERLRQEHVDGRRDGAPHFAVISNQIPGPVLAAKIASGAIPRDIDIVSPGQPLPTGLESLPPAWPTVDDAVQWCTAQASKLPFAMLAADSLVWKLAGRVLAAAAGVTPHENHIFEFQHLSSLFEQLLIQLQDFPAPPNPYRPQANEPSIDSGVRVRIISGFSGAGKTAWASQAAAYSSHNCAYYDCSETPDEALAVSLVRELAVKLSGAHQEVTRTVLLPGVTGLESLRVLDVFLASRGLTPVVVLDNAHRIGAGSLQRIVNVTTALRFVLLCQPTGSTQEVEALLDLSRESLNGWSLDELALAIADAGGRGSAETIGRLKTLTGGMPLFARSAARIAVSEYHGDVEQLCDSLERKTNTVETAQEVILSRVVDTLPNSARDAIAVLSLADLGLKPVEVNDLLKVLDLNELDCASAIRSLRAAGIVEIYGGRQLKVHDAVRVLGSRHLLTLGSDVVNRAQTRLKHILLISLVEQRDAARFSLYTRMLVATNDIKTLVDLIGEEMFHEMGIAPDIWRGLEAAVASESVDPEQRYWALDGLVFSDLKHHTTLGLPVKFEAMEALIREHNLGVIERMSFAMKRMNYQAELGDAYAVSTSIAAIQELLPDDPTNQRIFRYNAAAALFKLGRNRQALEIASQVVREYYQAIGTTPEQVQFRKHEDLWDLIDRPSLNHADIKHLGDALELYAIAASKLGYIATMERVHAMKFYRLAGAFDSLVRVGQDVADDFVFQRDFAGAREVLEQHVLPQVLEHKLLKRIVGVRSQYAVVLAYCGHLDAAEHEMARLEPYAAGFSEAQRLEIEGQKALIAEQRVRPVMSRQQAAALYQRSANTDSPRRSTRKIGRNDPCPCGSGKKFKRCHG